MTFLDKEYPISMHPTIDIVDNTKLGDWLTCRRMFFFCRVLGWELDKVNNDLHFGDSIHHAMAYLMRNWAQIISDPTEDIKPWVKGAYDAFIKRYREEIGPDDDERFAPKSPQYVPEMLVGYISQYRVGDKFQVLHAETAGTVPIGFEEDGTPIIIHFRMDTIVQDNGGVWILEHKTAKSFSRAWIEEFRLCWQLAIYNHVLYCLYPRDQVWGSQINGIQLTKTEGAKFMRVPVKMSQPIMNAWSMEINREMRALDVEFELLSKAKESDDVMIAFPKNPKSCTKYWGCPYSQFCVSWANPLQRCHEVPQLFRQRWWDPSDYEREGRTVFSLGEEVGSA